MEAAQEHEVNGKVHHSKNQEDQQAEEVVETEAVNEEVNIHEYVHTETAIGALETEMGDEAKVEDKVN